MEERYLPPSDFLQAIINEEVPFDQGPFGESNLIHLIAMTRDLDVANRDWAIMLLSQLNLDRPEVRDALLEASSDTNLNVRAEAILGLAQLDPAAALPLVKHELEGDMVTVPLLEAAILTADPSLVHDLQAFSEPSDDELLDKLVVDAIIACCASI